MSEAGSSMMKATLLNVIVTGAAAVLTLARSKISAEYLGPEGFGVSALVNQWIQLFAVGASMVTGPALISVLARKPGEQERRDVVRTAVLVIIGVNAVALSLAIPAEMVVGGGRGEVVPLLVLSGLTSTLSVLAQIPQATLIVGQRLAQLTKLVLLTTSISTLLVGAGTVLGGLWGQFVGAALGALVTLAIFWKWGLEQTSAPAVGGAKFNPPFLRHALTMGATSLIAALASQAALTSIRVSIERSMGAAANGTFQAAWGLNAMAFAALTGGLANHTFPRFGAAPNAVALSGEIKSALWFILRLAVPIAFVGLALHDLVMPILFSARFTGAITVIGLLICGDITRAAAWVLGGPLMYRGRVRGFLALELVGALALGLVAPHLIPRFGLVSVAAVYFGNATLQVALTAVVLQRIEKITLPLWGLASAFAAGGMALALWYYFDSLPALRWVALAIGTTLLGWEIRAFFARRGTSLPDATGASSG